MTVRRVLSLVACALIVSTALTVEARQRALRERQIFVSVLDKDDRPLPDVTPADLTVREDGLAREVLRVEPASDPMQVVLLADTSGGTNLLMQDLRKGLQVFAGTVWNANRDSEIALMEFGERPSQLADFSRTSSVLDRGIGRLFEHSNSGAYLLQAITDAAQTLKKKAAKRPVIVAFTSEESAEFSSETARKIEETLQSARVALWVVELNSRNGPGMSEEQKERGIVTGDVTAKSGGMRGRALDRMSIEPQLQKVAERLVSQYVVTYGRPESLVPPTKLEVTVKRPGAHLLSSRWAGQ
jgi:hypothetical protein